MIVLGVCRRDLAWEAVLESGWVQIVSRIRATEGTTGDRGLFVSGKGLTGKFASFGLRRGAPKGERVESLRTERESGKIMGCVLTALRFL